MKNKLIKIGFIAIFVVLINLTGTMKIYAAINEFPESYRTYLNELAIKYPNWEFKPRNTGLDWNTVVYNETHAKIARSLVQSKQGEWASVVWKNKVFDGSNWYAASQKAVAYAMDPRNNLTVQRIFQFEKLGFSNSHTEAGVEAILVETFMANTSIRTFYNNSNYTEKTFAKVIYETGRDNGVSPYYLASRIRQEIGKTAGDAVSGNYPDNNLKGYFNFYNIGATAGEGAVGRGVQYAKDNGWNTPEKAIQEGSKVITENYITAGQDTVYLQKFDLVGTLYTMQYMQNIQAPVSESSFVYNSYARMNTLNGHFVFEIPVFNNMPNESPEPNQNITPSVTKEVIITNTTVNLRAAANTSETPLIKNIGKNTELYRLEKGNIKVDGYLWDIVELTDGTRGYMATNYLTSGNVTLPAEKSVGIELKENEKIFVVEPDVTTLNIKNSYNNAVVTDKNGTVKSENDLVGTGFKIKMNNAEYTVIKLGDVNGDAKVNASDYGFVKNHIMQTKILDSISSSGADYNKDGKVNSSDYVFIKNYIMR